MKKSNLNTFTNDLKFVYSEDKSISVIFQDNEILMGVVGELNKNLKELEKLSGSSIYFRGNSIIIKGNDKKNKAVKEAIEFLTELYKINGSLEDKDIISSLDKFMLSEKNKNNQQNLDYIIKTPKKSVIPRSKKQKDYVRALKESEIIISCWSCWYRKNIFSSGCGAHYVT